MLLDGWTSRFEAEGYYVTPPLFSSVEVAEVRVACQRLLGNTRGWAVLGAAGSCEVLRGFAGHEVFREICLATLGSDVDLWFDGITFKPAGLGRALRWHQDAAYGRTDRPYTTCWTALDRADEDSGCLWVSPRSHERGPVEHTAHGHSELDYAGPVANTPPDSERPLILEPGEVAIMHSDLLHRSGRNTGTSDRIAYQCGYTDAATRFLDAGLASDLRLPLFRGAA